MICGLLGFGMVSRSQVVWPWVSWITGGSQVRFRGLQMGEAVGFRWVSGEVSWVVDGCGRGSQVRLEWVTEGSRWLRFCGFFGWQRLFLAGFGCKWLGLVAFSFSFLVGGSDLQDGVFGGSDGQDVGKK